MVAEKGRSGRGGGQIVRDGSSADEREKTEEEKLRSDAARIRGSYRYHNYGLAAPPAFAKRESERYRRGRVSSPSAASSSSGSSSRQRPSTPLVVQMEVDIEPEPEPPRLPHSVPDDYLGEEQFKLLLPQLSINAGLASGDFVAERELDTVVGLVARSSQQDADKADEWRHIAIEQDHVFVDLVSDEE